MAAERTVTDFVRALRSADVPVSPAEAIDAVRTLKLVGYGDRQSLKDGLRPVLAKSLEDSATYDRLFDLFFAPRPATGEAMPGETEDGEPAGEATPDTGTKPGADAADAGGEPASGPPTSPGGAGEAGAPDLLDLARNPDQVALQVAIERAGREVGVQDIRFSTQTGYYAQQMMKAMGVARLEARLLDRLQARTPDADAEADALMAARREMFQRARDHAEAQFDIYGAGRTERFREDVLAEKRLSDLDRTDLERMKALVAKMARRLAVKHSRRRRKRNRGVLDARRTLRANAGIGGVPFDLHWRQKRRDRPRIVVICDVSNSVARYVRFLLLLLHSLRDVVPDLEAYAFSARLHDVGPWLDTDGFEVAMQRILRDAGMGSTDYGQALSDLKTRHWHQIDRRTTVIILGDGRSNHGDPRLDIFRELTARAKRTLWLCPEPRSLWGTGDSEMLRYRPQCDLTGQVATLRDLERAVDDVLLAYA